MNTETIIEELERANRWRRGDESEPMPEPTRLGEAIDAAVTSLRSLVASNTTLRRERGEAREELASAKAELKKANDRWLCLAQIGREISDDDVTEIERLRSELARVKAELEDYVQHKKQLDAELACVKAERDDYHRKACEVADQRAKAEDALAELRRDKAKLCEELTNCANLLDQVRTGEDFECVCSDAADAARAAMNGGASCPECGREMTRHSDGRLVCHATHPLNGGANG